MYTYAIWCKRVKFVCVCVFIRTTKDSRQRNTTDGDNRINVGHPDSIENDSFSGSCLKLEDFRKVTGWREVLFFFRSEAWLENRMNQQSEMEI